MLYHQDGFGRKGMEGMAMNPRSLLMSALLLAALLAHGTALELSPTWRTADDALRGAAPLGDTTIATSDDLLVRIDWGRPEGDRQEVLAVDGFARDATFAFQGSVYAGCADGRWYVVEPASGGEAVWSQRPAGWRPPNAELDGATYHVEATSDGVVIYPAPGTGDAIADVAWTPVDDVWDEGVAHAGDRAVRFVWAGTPERLAVQAVDLADPTAPVVGPVTWLPTGYIRGIALHGHVLLAYGALIEAIAVDDVQAPQLIDSIGPSGGFLRLVVREDGLIAAWHDASLRLYRYTDDDGLSLVTALDNAPGLPSPLHLDASRVIAATEGGPRQFPVSLDPAGIEDGGLAWQSLTISQLAMVSRLATDGDLVWALGSHVFTVDPDHHGHDLGGVIHVGAATSPGPSFLDHHRGHLLRLGGGAALAIDDVADPRAPVTVATIAPTDELRAVARHEDLLAIGAGTTVMLYDISAPASPSLLGSLDVALPIRALGVDPAGPFVCAGDFAGGISDSLHVLDLSDPAEPAILASVALDPDDEDDPAYVVRSVRHGPDLALWVRDPYGWSGDASWLVDLSQPAAPVATTHAWRESFWGSTTPLDLAGRHVVGHAGWLQVQGWQGDPADNEIPEAEAPLLGPAKALVAHGSVILAGTEHAIEAFTVGDPDHVAAPVPPVPGHVRIAPNPFNPRASVLFTMARAGNVDLRVYDARGRCLRHLAAELPAGPASLTWDGATDTGRPAPSGLYLVRVTTPDGEARGRCCLVR
jgi:hypothetical protein